MPNKKRLSAKEQRTADRRAALKWAVEGVTPEIILGITCVVLGIAIALLVFTGYGMKIGQRLSDGEVSTNSTVVSIVNIAYNQYNYNYDADATCLSGKSSEKCLLQNYGVKNKNYAVITSFDQLQRLLGIMNSIGNQNAEAPVDASFFNSGSLIAIVKEDEASEYSLTNAYRDKKYGLHFQTKLSKGETENSSTGHLILVSVQNIQTSDISVIEAE